MNDQYRQCPDCRTRMRKFRETPDRRQLFYFCPKCASRGTYMPRLNCGSQDGRKGSSTRQFARAFFREKVSYCYSRNYTVYCTAPGPCSLLMRTSLGSICAALIYAGLISAEPNCPRPTSVGSSCPAQTERGRVCGRSGRNTRVIRGDGCGRQKAAKSHPARGRPNRSESG